MSKPDEKKDTALVKKPQKIKGLIGKIKSIKHIDMIIAGVAVVIMLIIYFTTFIKPDEKPSGDTSAGSDGRLDYCSAVVRELESNLSQMSGAGKVLVLINWESSVEQIPAHSTGSSGSTSVITVGGQIYVLKTVYPKPVGIIIICDGANNISIKMNLISAVSSYFSISENTIIVLARAN